MVRVAALRGETDEAHEKVLQVGSWRDRHRIWSDRRPDLCCDHRCPAADRQQPEDRVQQRCERAYETQTDGVAVRNPDSSTASTPTFCPVTIRR